MSIEDDVKAMIPRMTQEIAEKIKATTLANIEHTTARAISEEVTKYIADEVMPLVRADLVAQQDAIKAAIVAAAHGIAEQLAVTLVERFTVKLSGYEGDKLITNVFGPLFRGY